MKRRDFLKSGTVVVGLASSASLLAPSEASGSPRPSKVPAPPPAPIAEHRSADYLHRAQTDRFLPKAAVPAEVKLPADVKISPMPLKERLDRGVAPRKGVCSIRPGKSVSEGLTTGNGPMYIEATCDPYAEKILFHHESLLMPWKRPIEAPNVARILPQLRQMILDGKYQEAAEYAFKTMDESPVKKNTFPHWTVPAFQMALELPKTEAARSYLRTLDFESGEIAVHWSDERGDWLRKAFASRPDNVVVQLLTAPKGQKVNARITVQKPAAPMRWWGNVTSGESEFREDFSS